MEPVTLENELADLMTGHEVEFHVEDEWIVPSGKLPAIRATWVPRENSGRLDIDVLLEDERIIDEYMDDSENISLVSLGAVLREDDSFIHLLDKEAGVAFAKGEDGIFVELD